jgi:hypothetical protein
MKINLFYKERRLTGEIPKNWTLINKNLIYFGLLISFQEYKLYNNYYIVQFVFLKMY